MRINGVQHKFRLESAYQLISLLATFGFWGRNLSSPVGWQWGLACVVLAFLAMCVVQRSAKGTDYEGNMGWGELFLKVGSNAMFANLVVYIATGDRDGMHFLEGMVFLVPFSMFGIHLLGSRFKYRFPSF
ncbi:hypothetical protein [Aquitalea sp. ASV15]|uniref:hypothetical protein n=1 Tax=Aquitalea sp. ASV15 TaxID=2795104 RepID=UPI0018EC39A5|nr:hypothetical protein [Aquitalea sp. ASV15]